MILLKRKTDEYARAKKEKNATSKFTVLLPGAQNTLNSSTTIDMAHIDDANIAKKCAPAHPRWRRSATPSTELQGTPEHCKHRCLRQSVSLKRDLNSKRRSEKVNSPYVGTLCTVFYLLFEKKNQRAQRTRTSLQWFSIVGDA